MAIQYRLTITEQDMEKLHAAKDSGESIPLFLKPINPAAGLKELAIEVTYGERPVEKIEDEQPSVEEPMSAEPAAEELPDDTDVTAAEMTPGFAGESRVSSFSSFFKINEEKEEKEDKKEEDDDKEESKDEDKDSKPKFGSPEWHEKYGKKKKKK